MNDQPRWPAGTPVRPDGNGPGGGRWRGRIRYGGEEHMWGNELLQQMGLGRRFEVFDDARGRWVEILKMDPPAGAELDFDRGGRIHTRDPSDGYKDSMWRYGGYRVREVLPDEDTPPPGPDWAERLFSGSDRFTAGFLSHADVAQYLGRDDYRVFGSAAGAYGRVEFREYSDGRLLAYKLLHTPHAAEIRSEYETSLIARAIGAPTPAAVIDPARPDSGILMEFIQQRAGSTVEIWSAGQESVASDAGRMLGLLDLITTNPDRHLGNVVLTWDGPVGVDHGWALRLPFEPATPEGGPTPASMAVSSSFGRQLVRWHQTTSTVGQSDGRHVQWWFSKRAIREARRRIEAVADLREPTQRRLAMVLDVLEEMSIGDQMLG